MIKASNDLQDLRRRLYVKAKSETSWRFWGLYVHVCKMETLRKAYALAEDNDGRLANVILQPGRNLLFQFERSLPCGLDFSNQRQRDLSIRPHRNRTGNIRLLPDTDRQHIVIADYKCVVVCLARLAGMNGCGALSDRSWRS